MDKNKEILNNIIDKYNLKIEDMENSIQILQLIKEYKLKIELIDNYPEVLNIKPSKFENVINKFKENELNIKLLEKFPKIFEETTGARIENITKVLKEENISEKIIEKYPSIISVGRDKDIPYVIAEFKKYRVDKKYFMSNGDVLAYAKLKDIRKILKKLYDNNLLSIVLKNTPQVFYTNTGQVVEDICDFVDSPRERLGIEILKTNPEILYKTTKVRISAIINLLERQNLDRKIVLKYPEILYMNETKEIEDIIGILKEKKLDAKNIEKHAYLLAIQDKDVLNEEIAKILKETPTTQELKIESKELEQIEEKTDKTKENKEIKMNEEEKVEITEQDSIKTCMTEDELNEIEKLLQDTNSILENAKKDKEQIKEKEDEINHILAEFDIKNLVLPSDLINTIDPKEIIEVLSFLDSIEMKRIVSLFPYILNMPKKAISENISKLIEEGQFNNIENIVEVLEEDVDILDKQIEYILDNNFYEQKQLKIQDILEIINNEKEKQKYNSFEILRKKANEYLGGKYVKYIENSNFLEELSDEEYDVYINIYDRILELGTVKDEIVYIKRDENFSLIKIEDNLQKIIKLLGKTDNLKLEEYDINEIMSAAILSGKRMLQEAYDKVYEGILKQEKPSEWEEIRNLHKQAQEKKGIIVDIDESKKTQSIDEMLDSFYGNVEEEDDDEIEEQNIEIKDTTVKENQKEEIEKKKIAIQKEIEKLKELEKQELENVKTLRKEVGLQSTEKLKIVTPNEIEGNSLNETMQINSPIANKTIEKDMEEGAKKGLDEIEKTFNTKITIDEKIILQELEAKAKREEELRKQIELKRQEELKQKREAEYKEKMQAIENMQGKLGLMTSQLKQFKADMQERELEIKARERKRIQDIKDRRARNKTEEEARKLEETAKKLELQAAKLEKERLLIEEERKKELARIKEEEEKRLLELEKQKEEETKKREEEVKRLAEEAKKREEEIAKLKAETIAKIEEEKNKLQELVKIEAEKILREQGLIKDNRRINLLYENRKNNNQNIKVNNIQKEAISFDNIETKEEYPDDISAYYKDNQDDYYNLSRNVSLNIDNEVYAKTNINDGGKLENFDSVPESDRPRYDAFMEEDNFIEEKKDFFNLMDYGYIAQIVDDEEQRKMQKSMNEIFRRKKMEDLDDLD